MMSCHASEDRHLKYQPLQRRSLWLIGALLVTMEGVRYHWALANQGLYATAAVERAM